MKPIQIKGARENNLKSIDLNIEKGKIVVFTGPSGSGKSSIVFDTIAAESQRQLNETYPFYIRHKLPSFERPKVDSIENITPAIIVDQKRIGGGSRSTVATLIDVAPLFRLLYSRSATPALGLASAYSFNSPAGMCPSCKGIGQVVQLDLNKLLDKKLSLNGGAILFKPWAKGGWQWRLYGHSGFFDLDKPIEQYNDEEWYNLLHGSGRKVIIENDPSGVWYEGIVDRFNRLYLNRDISTLSNKVQKSVQDVVSVGLCNDCKGYRLNEAALKSKIEGLNITELLSLEVKNVFPFIKQIKDPIGQSIVLQIQDVLKRMLKIGLQYLSLDRRTDTLSGGEAQRLKLIKHLGSSLVGITYILDEPTTGLHPIDVDKIIQLLVQLRDKGNSVLVVEHEPSVIEAADWVVDIGPYAGSLGGQVVFTGTPEALKKAHTLTASSLKKTFQMNHEQKDFYQWLSIDNASKNNLKGFSTRLPLGALVAVTGVSGSGKTSLMFGDFLSQYPQTKVLDQKPVGVSSRSNLATYLGLMDKIRDIYAQKNNVKSALFSFNSLGMCPNCQGRGEIAADMVYADSVIIRCESCQGQRYNTEALQYYVNNFNIAQTLQMTVDEAINFFDDVNINNTLNLIQEVGLGYLSLGQSTSIMSGGEVQRMKLSDSLHGQGNIILLDEPTSGLHMSDISQMIKLLKRIVADGNTVIVIEHNQQMIIESDWAIDLGPQGGSQGGDLVYQGPISGLLKQRDSITGQMLLKTFKNMIR